MICKHCATPFPPNTRPDKRYCDSRCRYQAFKAKNGDKPYFNQEPKSYDRICVVCDTPFTTGKSHGRTCSARCSSERLVIAKRAFMSAAKAKPCEDCGVEYPSRVMHFHHKDPSTKKFTLATGPASWPMREIEAEIAKCELLCANCHALRHS